MSTEPEYALMYDGGPKPEQTACDIMMHGVDHNRWRRIYRDEYDYWMMHLLPRHHSMMGVPQSWKETP